MIKVFTDKTVQNKTLQILQTELKDVTKPVFFIVPEFAKAQIEGMVIGILNNPQDINVNKDETDAFISEFNLDEINTNSENAEYINNSIRNRNAIYSVLKNDACNYPVLSKFYDSSEVVGLVSGLLDQANESELDKLAESDSEFKKSVYIELIKLRDALSGVRDIEVGSSFVNGDILSFRKLSSRLMESGGKTLAGSSDEILLRNAIYAILVNNSDKFQSFKNLASKFDYINMIIRILGDFARYNIDSEQIRAGIKVAESSKEPDNAYISKLKDIAYLMECISEINEKYNFRLMSDPIGISNEMLRDYMARGGKPSSRLDRGLAKCLNSRFVFIGFGATRTLTPKEAELVNLLSELSVDVHLYSLYTDDKNNVETIYKAGKEFTEFFKSKGATIIPMAQETNVTEIAGIIEKYAHHDESVDKLTDKIHLSEIKNTDDRIGYMFDEIVKLTHKDGYRYRDIRIVCCDDSLIGRLRSVSTHFGLDVFIDQKILLSNTPIPYITQIILELPKSNYSLENLLKAMRSGFLKMPQMYIADAFDNFCHKYNIMDITHGIFDEDTYLMEKDGEKLKKDSVYIYDKTFPSWKKDEDFVEEGNKNAGVFFWYNLVKPILIPLRTIAEEINDEEMLSGKAALLMKYLDNNKTYTELLAEELVSLNKDSEAAALIRGYDEMMSLLSNFTHEMNDVSITQKAFISLIRTDMRNKTQGTIPLNVDSVEITTVDRAFVSPCKVLFLIGAKKDNFPYKKRSEGLLSDSELEHLKNDISVGLPNKRDLESRQEFTTACLILGTASDHIYMLHEFGQAKSRVYEFFENHVDRNKIGINNYEMPVNEEPVTKNYNFENAQIDPEIIDKLIGDKFILSVSRLQDYNECHHKFMLDRILKVRPREDNTEIRSNRFGSLMHRMLQDSLRERVSILDSKEKMEKFFLDVVSNEAEMDKMADEYVVKSLKSKEDGIPGSIDSEGNIKPEFMNNPGQKLKRMFITVFPDVVKNCMDQNFRPAEFEAEIGPDKTYQKTFKVGDKEFSFTGSIDRLDLNFDNPDSFRIHDYKTGDKNLSPSEFVEGVQIQLPAYASAVKSSVESRELESFGYSLLGIKADSGKDYSLAIKDSHGSTLFENNKYLALKYADYIIQKDCEDIVSGKADALVYNKDACEFCNYRGLCGNKIFDSAKRTSLAGKFDEDEDIKKLDEEIAQKPKGVEKLKAQRQILVIKKHLGEE